MERADLEKLTINELRELAARYTVNTKGCLVDIFDRLLTYFDKEGWPEKTIVTGSLEESKVNLPGPSASAELLAAENLFMSERGKRRCCGANSRESEIDGIRRKYLWDCDNSRIKCSGYSTGGRANISRKTRSVSDGKCDGSATAAEFGRFARHDQWDKRE